MNVVQLIRNFVELETELAHVLYFLKEFESTFHTLQLLFDHLQVFKNSSKDLFVVLKSLVSQLKINVVGCKDSLELVVFSTCNLLNELLLLQILVQAAFSLVVNQTTNEVEGSLSVPLFVFVKRED